MKKDSVLGLKIAYYRKLNGLTQEELAEKVGVSTQAVSKWEQQLSCPDIMLLPTLANIFRVTIDELFGERSGKAPVYSLVPDLPWPDDGKVRLALYYGRKLMDMSDHLCVEGTNLVDFVFHGGSFKVNGVCKFVRSKSDK